MKKKNDPRDMTGSAFSWYERDGYRVQLVFYRGRTKITLKLDEKQFREIVASARHSEAGALRRAQINANHLGHAVE